MKNESIDNLSTKMQNLSIFTSLDIGIESIEKAIDKLTESIDCKANDQTGAVLAGLNCRI